MNKYFFICVLLLCVCVHECACECVCIYMCSHGGQMSMLGIFLKYILYIIILSEGFSLNLEITIRLEWLAKRILSSPL